jgi:hypothetical protein
MTSRCEFVVVVAGLLFLYLVVVVVELFIVVFRRSGSRFSLRLELVAFSAVTSCVLYTLLSLRLVNRPSLWVTIANVMCCISILSVTVVVMRMN